MGDQDHDCFFSSIMLENTGNQIPSAFDQVTPSKTITPTTKSPSSIIEKESYKKKKCDQLATNHLNQELLHEIKNYILSLQQDSKTDYVGEYIKAMLDQIASLKSDIMCLRGEVNGKNAFIEQLNNNNNNIINRNNKAIMITMIIVFLIKLVIVLLISLTIIILVILLTTLITIITILIMTVVLIKIITAITKMTIIIFLIKLVTVFLIYLTITILVMFLTALIMITIIIITAIITKIVKFSLK